MARESGGGQKRDSSRRESRPQIRGGLGWSGEGPNRSKIVLRADKSLISVIIVGRKCPETGRVIVIGVQRPLSRQVVDNPKTKVDGIEDVTVVRGVKSRGLPDVINARRAPKTR